MKSFKHAGLIAGIVLPFAAAYAMDATITEKVTAPTSYSSYMNEDNSGDVKETTIIRLDSGAEMDISNVGWRSFVTDLTAMISLGMNDGREGHSGGFMSNDNIGIIATSGAINLKATRNVADENPNFVGIGAKKSWTALGGQAFVVSVDIEIATIERSRIEMNYDIPAHNAIYVSAIYAENVAAWSASASVKLSNIDVVLNSQAASTAWGAAVSVRTDGNKNTTSYTADESVTVSTSGSNIHGIYVRNSSGVQQWPELDGYAYITNRGSIATNGQAAHAILVEKNAGKVVIKNSGNLSALGESSYAILVRKLDNGGVSEAAVDLILDGDAVINGNINLGSGKRLFDIGNTKQKVQGNVALSGSNATFSARINSASDMGHIEVQGIDLTGAMLLVDFSFAYLDTLRGGETFELISGTVTGEFSNAPDGKYVVSNGGKDYHFLVEYGEHLMLTYVVIPEPGFFGALLGTLALGFVASRRRK